MQYLRGLELDLKRWENMLINAMKFLLFRNFVILAFTKHRYHNSLVTLYTDYHQNPLLSKQYQSSSQQSSVGLHLLMVSLDIFVSALNRLHGDTFLPDSEPIKDLISIKHRTSCMGVSFAYAAPLKLIYIYCAPNSSSYCYFKRTKKFFYKHSFCCF